MKFGKLLSVSLAVSLAAAPEAEAQTFDAATLPTPSRLNPVLLGVETNSFSAWLIVVDLTHCEDSQIRNVELTLATGVKWSRGNALATYCGQRLIYYRGQMPYIEWVQKLGSGQVYDQARPAQDFKPKEMIHLYSADSMKAAFDEWNNRALRRERAAAVLAQARKPQPIASSAKPANGAPNPTDIARAFAGADVRFTPGAETTGVSGETSRGPMMNVRRTVDGLSCAVLKAGYRCTFKLHIEVVPTNIISQMALAFQEKNTTQDWTTTFYKSGPGWRSTQIDVAFQKAAAAAAADNDARQASDSDDERRRQRQRDYDSCRAQNKYDLTTVCNY